MSDGTLVFERISIDKYISVLDLIFWSSRDSSSPMDFAKQMSLEPVESYYGGAGFYAVPTPSGHWGWCYETISERLIYWLPTTRRVGTVVAELKDSQIFRNEILGWFGESSKNPPPEWLRKASYVMTDFEVPRPVICEYTPDLDSILPDLRKEMDPEFKKWVTFIRLGPKRALRLQARRFPDDSVRKQVLREFFGEKIAYASLVFRRV